MLSKSRQKQLNKAVVDCIIDDSLPFTAFTKPGMMNLLKTFDSRYRPPSRFTIASRVGEAYYQYVAQVKVCQWRTRHGDVALPLDVWVPPLSSRVHRIDFVCLKIISWERTLMLTLSCVIWQHVRGNRCTGFYRGRLTIKRHGRMPRGVRRVHLSQFSTGDDHKVWNSMYKDIAFRFYAVS